MVGVDCTSIFGKSQSKYLTVRSGTSRGTVSLLVLWSSGPVHSYLGFQVSYIDGCGDQTHEWSNLVDVLQIFNLVVCVTVQTSIGHQAVPVDQYVGGKIKGDFQSLEWVLDSRIGGCRTRFSQRDQFSPERVGG